MESMRDVIDLVMDEKITSEVWMDLKDLIEAKSVIRRNVMLRLELEPHPQLQEHEAVLKIEHQYELWPLRDKKLDFTIKQELDYQFDRPDLGLPKREFALIDDPASTKRVLSHEALLSPQLEIPVSLQPRRHNQSVFVQSHRQEIVHLPGSYNFYVPEFMKRLRMTLVGVPADFDVEVLVRPHGGDARSQVRIPHGPSMT
jgi:hypothetical protein